MNKLSQWSKDVKKTLIDRDMTMRQLAEQIGYGPTTISAVITGRYPNATGDDIVAKINGVLGTKGGPERTNTASKEWCTSVKVELMKRDMTVNDLARAAGVTRDKMSCIINGKQWDEGIIAKIVETLGVEAPILAPARKV